jgi:hypothetical protein
MNTDSAFFGTVLAMVALLMGYPITALIIFIIGVSS